MPDENLKPIGVLIRLTPISSAAEDILVEDLGTPLDVP